MPSEVWSPKGNINGINRFTPVSVIACAPKRIAHNKQLIFKKQKAATNFVAAFHIHIAQDQIASLRTTSSIFSFEPSTVTLSPTRRRV